MEWYFGQSGTLERASGSSFGASWRGVLALVGPLVTFLSALGPLWGLSWWAPPLLGHSWGSLGGLKGRPGARHWVPRGRLVVPRGPQGVLKGSPRGRWNAGVAIKYIYIYIYIWCVRLWGPTLCPLLEFVTDMFLRLKYTSE